MGGKFEVTLKTSMVACGAGRFIWGGQFRVWVISHIGLIFVWNCGNRLRGYRSDCCAPILENWSAFVVYSPIWAGSLYSSYSNASSTSGGLDIHSLFVYFSDAIPYGDSCYLLLDEQLAYAEGSRPSRISLMQAVWSRFPAGISLLSILWGTR